jgi:hypothetical protein
VLRRGDQLLASCGETAFRSTIQAELAEMHVLLGDREAVSRAIAFADQLSAAEDAINITIEYPGARPDRPRRGRSRGRRAVGARRGGHGVGDDFSMVRGAAALDLARVLAALGRGDEALLEARRALGGLEGQGDRPAAAAARALLEELAAR